MSRNIEIDVRVTAPGWRRHEPAAATLACDAARAALDSRPARGVLRSLGSSHPVELAIVLADDRSVRALNRRYRGIDRPTNVLSFPAQDFAAPRRPLLPGAPVALGDIVLAWQTVCREAAEQGKTVAAHLKHLVVHGTLHLLGYDHEDAASARRMEGLEVRVLAGLGVADPYRAARRAA